MKILFIHHYERNNLNKFRGSIPIISQLIERKNEVKHIAKNEWFHFFKTYNNFKPDVIVTCGPVAGIITLLYRCKLIGSTIIFHWGDNYSEIMGQKWGKRLISFLEKSAVKYSDAVISISKYRFEKAKKEFDKTPLKNLFYIPLGYNKLFLKKSKKLLLPGKNKIKVVYSGEISKSKKFDEINKFFSKLSNIDFIFLGPNENIVLQKNKNVFYLGFKPPEEVYSYLKSADFLLITEDNDSSLKLFEYQVFGKPILAPYGRISKYLKLENNLYYHNFLDIPSLIKTTKIFKPMAIFTWEEISDKYFKIIKNIHSKKEKFVKKEGYVGV
ncbi:MAG: hypothetical protein ABIF88_03620 [archaeon]